MLLLLLLRFTSALPVEDDIADEERFFRDIAQVIGSMELLVDDVS